MKALPTRCAAAFAWASNLYGRARVHSGVPALYLLLTGIFIRKGSSTRLVAPKFPRSGDLCGKCPLDAEAPPPASASFFVPKWWARTRARWERVRPERGLPAGGHQRRRQAVSSNQFECLRGAAAPRRAAPRYSLRADSNQGLALAILIRLESAGDARQRCRCSKCRRCGVAGRVVDHAEAIKRR